MRDHILLYVNGRRHEVRDRAFTSLSTFLREDLGLTGTKIVCAEGDCGSCATLLGKPEGERILYRPVCSCIQYLFQLDGTHVVTVEGLAYDGALNPVQEAMVRCQGSQCGFCTPGFVVSMCAILDQNPAPTKHDWTRGLTGNLCRCTGYEAILKAGMETDRAALRKPAELYDERAIAAELTKHLGEAVAVRSGAREFFKPTTLAQATAHLAARPECLIVAGGTDLGVQANKGFREFTSVLSTRSLDELRGVERTSEALLVGAGTSLADLELALADALPSYATMLDRFGSPLIKNAGTLGGNIANGSPIGDSMPGLFVLRAEIELAGPRGRRWVDVNEYYTGYKQSVRAKDELLTRVKIPFPRAGERFRVYKVSRRRDLDISSVTAAFWVRLAGDVIDDVRIAYGGVGPNIVRLRATEAALRGRPFTEATWASVGATARGEIAPISDVRGDAAYRRRLAENFLLKFYFDSTNDHDDFANGPPPTGRDGSQHVANGKGGVR